MHDTNPLLSLLFFLLAAVVFVPLFRWFRLGAILGYLFAGVLIGPGVLNVISDPESVLHFAEIGVVFLLFSLIYVIASNNKETAPLVAEKSPAIASPSVAIPPIETPSIETSLEPKKIEPEKIEAQKVEPLTPSANESQDATVNSLYETREQQTEVPAPEIVVTLPPEQTELEVTNSNTQAPSPPVVSDQSVVEPVIESNEIVAAAIPSVFALDVATQRTIPDIKYDAQIYASDNNSGFVIFNGAKKQVGDSLRNGLFIEKINQEDVVLSFNGLLFTLPALKSWSYQ